MTCRAARDDQFDIYNTHVISGDMWYRFSETYRLWCDTAEKCNEKSGLELSCERLSSFNKRNYRMLYSVYYFYRYCRHKKLTSLLTAD